MTHFDVIPIASDGRFTTPPLPPNRYEFELCGHACHDTGRKAIRATTSRGSATVVIPETGEIPPVEIVARANEARRRRPGQGSGSEEAAAGGACPRRGRLAGQGLRDPALRPAERLSGEAAIEDRWACGHALSDRG